jgi:hypothetical protein
MRAELAERLGDPQEERSLVDPRRASILMLVIPPFRRDRLARRERETIAESALGSASERLAMSIALSDLARRLARAAEARWITCPESDLAERARTHAPRALAHR